MDIGGAFTSNPALMVAPRYRHSCWLKSEATRCLFVSTTIMFQKSKTPNHVYTVELVFMGEPSEISDRLNLQPNNAFSQSQNRPPPSRQHPPYWGYNGERETGYQSRWESLEDGLIFLLEVMDSRREKIIAIGHQFNGHWWCGHFQSSFDGGPTLSAKLLVEISNYEIPLRIANYYSSEE
ncbi:DUF4279 domain-containing protein [Verminephrobacter aporrectodeae subsp. tuberculatae]|nr:DUF4279 domain-containing protein [Verminephrobacter aporrectodeae subsp. tuberculatae]MCW8170749.1 DUF4279 domain-containing protein [Verminephrobacter aporrectodeae subsp. tuberculatae]